MQLWEVATWGAFERSHLHLGLFCLLCLRVEVGAATPKTLLNLPRCKCTVKGSICLTTVEGFLSHKRAFEQILKLFFIQSEEKVNTFIKGLSKTWISHSNANKCMRYNYAKCIFLFFLRPICVASSSTCVKELFWIANSLISLFIETSLRWSENARRHSPNTVRAGTDSRFSQKETWDRMTVMMHGR